MVPHPHDADTLWVFPMDGSDVWPRISPGGKPAANHARGAKQARVDVLKQPSKRFDHSLQVARRKAQRIQRSHNAQASPAKSSGGSFPSAESLGVSMATLNSIASCESGGNPAAGFFGAPLARLRMPQLRQGSTVVATMRLNG